MSSLPASETTATPVTEGRPSAGGASRQSTLWAASWPSPPCARLASDCVPADLIVPPFASSVLASTAIPVGAVFGSTTV